jgi:IS605 OrfB family transposase
MRSVKAIRFSYEPTAQTTEILETFRMMVNHAIQIALNENIKGRLNLRNRVYREFRERYGVHSHYPHSVAEVAWSIVKKHRKWHRRPLAKRPMMKLDVEAYSLNYSILSTPFKTGERRLLIPLQYGEYQRSFLMDKATKRGSLTITASSILITFSKEASPTEPLRKIGYDLNEKSVVASDYTKYEVDVREVARLHTLYGIRRRSFYCRHASDRRLKKKFTCSRREQARVKQALHRVTSQIVEKSRVNKEAIILERLKGIRHASRRGDGKTRASRRRIAQWPFRLLQSQIVYKAAWAGVAVEFVSAAYTSKTCNLCGAINRKLKLQDRSWLCPCGAKLDRDLNAAINIERRGKIRCLGEVRPEARGTDEAVKGNETMTKALVLQAEAPKLTK